MYSSCRVFPLTLPAAPNPPTYGAALPIQMHRPCLYICILVLIENYSPPKSISICPSQILYRSVPLTHSRPLDQGIQGAATSHALARGIHLNIRVNCNVIVCERVRFSAIKLSHGYRTFSWFRTVRSFLLFAVCNALLCIISIKLMNSIVALCTTHIYLCQK